jgi:hypothetical protein
MELNFRALKAEEIEVRIGSVTEKGLSLLLYMDARAAALLLDETVGPMNWKNSYRDINGKMYCGVDIWDSDKKEWVSKENVGTESNTEAEKGEASDGLKRAVATWGVRELYTSPFIWVDANQLKSHFNTEWNGKKTWKSNDKFEVSAVDIEIVGYSRRITKLQITNTSTKKLCFDWEVSKGQRDTSSPKPVKAKSEPYTATAEQIAFLAQVYKGENLEKLCISNGIGTIAELPYSKAVDLIDKLKERAEKNAS